MIEQGPDAFLAKLLEKSHADIDEWQTQMQLKPQAIGNIHLYAPALGSGHQWTGVQEVDSIEQAVLASLDRHRSDTLAVIPEGPYLVPFFSPELTTPSTI